MNEPLPPWRSFPSAPQRGASGPPGRPVSGVPGGPGRGAPGGPPTDAPTDRATDEARPWQSWLIPALAGVGGLLVGVVGVALVFVALMGLPTPAADGAFGEPLDFAAAADRIPVEAVAPAGIVVDVAGAVVRPGLHRLDTGARVGDAIGAAGGFAPRADLAAASQALNLAQTLEDGAKELVPELGTVRVGEASSDGRIDLNSAGQAELESLPGIGPVTAGKIIDARREKRFGSVRDLRSRGLVGESVYADIKSLVTAG